MGFSQQKPSSHSGIPHLWKPAYPNIYWNTTFIAPQFSDLLLVKPASITPYQTWKINCKWRFQKGKSVYTGWWYTYPSEKYDFVSWDDDIPNWMENHKDPWFQNTNH